MTVQGFVGKAIELLNFCAFYYVVLLVRCALISFAAFAIVITVRNTLFKNMTFLKGAIWALFVPVLFAGKMKLFDESRMGMVFSNCCRYIGIKHIKNIMFPLLLDYRNTAGDSYNFSDRRASNSEIRATYYSFALFVYGFLAIVALIAAFNIINNIGISVSARMNQYGAMRAIGTSIRQLKSMVVAETSTYLMYGLMTGLALGLPLHYVMYQKMITSHWGDVWNLPASEFCIISLVMLISAVIAVIRPMQRISKMPIIETISAQ